MYHRRIGIQNLSFAREEARANYLMNPQQIEDSLGRRIKGQIDGYLSGALRFTFRLFGGKSTHDHNKA